MNDNRNQDYFRAFADISKVVSSTLKLHKVLDRILFNTIEALDLKAGAISLLNRKGNRLEMIAHLNLSQEFLDKGPVLADKSIPRALRTGQPVIVPDISKDDQLQYPEACEKEDIAALMSIPIVFQDTIIGMLRLYSDKVRDFSAKEVEFMNAIAEQGGVAIQNARVMQQLKKDHKRELDDLWNWFSDFSDMSGY
ncbi:MAG: GAF domain-containing protein [Candidatus Marinimicrobia bacterium]|nr:GAF domain-containing protein [Candidatus Neomarinimicrobiota bacterium]